MDNLASMDFFYYYIDDAELAIHLKGKSWSNSFYMTCNSILGVILPPKVPNVVTLPSSIGTDIEHNSASLAFQTMQEW